MNLKKSFATLLLLGSLAVPAMASEEIEPESSFLKTVNVIYKGLKACTNATLRFAKEHPFITMSFLVAIASEKMRKMIVTLPGDAMHQAQKRPIITLIIGGVFLNYLL